MSIVIFQTDRTYTLHNYNELSQNKNKYTIAGVTFTGCVDKRKLGDTEFVYRSFYNNHVNEELVGFLIKNGKAVGENPIGKEFCGYYLSAVGFMSPQYEYVEETIRGPVMFAKYDKYNEPVDLTEGDLAWFSNYQHKSIEQIQRERGKCVLL